MLVEIDRIIDRSIRESRAIDVEALCILVGRKVWSIRVDIHVLDDVGNVIDAAVLATVRRPA
jgi:exosome complex component RRP45